MKGMLCDVNINVELNIGLSSQTVISSELWPRLYMCHILLGCSNRGNEMCRTCCAHGRDQKCAQNFSRKPEGKRPCGRPKSDGKLK
jgi:hypothetical protein